MSLVVTNLVSVTGLPRLYFKLSIHPLIMFLSELKGTGSYLFHSVDQSLAHLRLNHVQEVLSNSINNAHLDTVLLIWIEGLVRQVLCCFCPCFLLLLL